MLFSYQISDRQLGCEGKEKATPSVCSLGKTPLPPAFAKSGQLFELATIRANQMYMRHGMYL